MQHNIDRLLEMPMKDIITEYRTPGPVINELELHQMSVPQLYTYLRELHRCLENTQDMLYACALHTEHAPQAELECMIEDLHFYTTQAEVVKERLEVIPVVLNKDGEFVNAIAITLEALRKNPNENAELISYWESVEADNEVQLFTPAG